METCNVRHFKKQNDILFEIIKKLTLTYFLQSLIEWTTVEIISKFCECCCFGGTSALTVTQLILVKVAGIRFSFNPTQDPGCRILENTVSIDEQPLDRNMVCICIYLGDSIMGI